MTILNVVASCGQVYVCDDTVVDGLDFQFRMSLRQPGGAASHRPGVRNHGLQLQPPWRVHNEAVG